MISLDETDDEIIGDKIVDKEDLHFRIKEFEVKFKDKMVKNPDEKYVKSKINKYELYEISDKELNSGDSGE